MLMIVMILVLQAILSLLQSRW